VAINWNAPLVWIAAFVDEQGTIATDGPSPGPTAWAR